MNSTEKIAALVRLGQYLTSDEPALQLVKERAEQANGWFTPAFMDKAIQSLTAGYLQEASLTSWLESYQQVAGTGPKSVGIVAAGNIPMVGFHDWLCGFVSGHQVKLKLSSKDEVLMKHVLAKMEEWYPACEGQTVVQDMLKDCDAYIATGSNNSARYFEYYFAKYPHIIRRNRTSVAILTGGETAAQLSALADDVMLYFGLGCRNVTKIYVPVGYDFVPLLEAFKRYDYLVDHHKYKNNYDYNLALLLLNNSYYMTNSSLLLHESSSLFSPISVLHYAFYEHADSLRQELRESQDVQCLVGDSLIPFGSAQHPTLADYADGIDTMRFLRAL
ncbi:acyl-CoA reductase [Chitinophaga pendula]|uniref:acyl-CoA reductase n=1 Tax=Chitinophaga TaxID=79328 RepID=UPI000BB04BBB|nr:MULTISPECIES: acyl-CoA reductase [Chitinophaga]ASZ11994.1 acyl-CoA reductase [Chitinophaga sp. MD30]UCJ04977.1 acyl-CoA reductase [Chitinophaga pendula]